MKLTNSAGFVNLLALCGWQVDHFPPPFAHLKIHKALTSK